MSVLVTQFSGEFTERCTCSQNRPLVQDTFPTIESGVPSSAGQMGVTYCVLGLKPKNRQSACSDQLHNDEVDKPVSLRKWRQVALSVKKNEERSFFDLEGKLLVHAAILEKKQILSWCPISVAGMFVLTGVASIIVGHAVAGFSFLCSVHRVWHIRFIVTPLAAIILCCSLVVY